MIEGVGGLTSTDGECAPLVALPLCSDQVAQENIADDGICSRLDRRYFCGRDLVSVRCSSSLLNERCPVGSADIKRLAVLVELS